MIDCLFAFCFFFPEKSALDFIKPVDTLGVDFIKGLGNVSSSFKDVETFTVDLSNDDACDLILIASITVAGVDAFLVKNETWVIKEASQPKESGPYCVKDEFYVPEWPMCNKDTLKKATRCRNMLYNLSNLAEKDFYRKEDDKAIFRKLIVHAALLGG